MLQLVIRKVTFLLKKETPHRDPLKLQLLSLLLLLHLRLGTLLHQQRHHDLPPIRPLQVAIKHLQNHHLAAIPELRLLQKREHQGLQEELA